MHANMEEADRQWNKRQITIPEYAELIDECTDRYFSRMKIVSSLTEELTTRLLVSNRSRITTLLDHAIENIRHADSQEKGKNLFSIVSESPEEEQVNIDHTLISTYNVEPEIAVGETAVTIPLDETVTVDQPDESLEEIVTEIGLTSHRPILATETEIGTTAVTEPPAETVAEVDDCHTEEWKSSNSCDSPLTVEEIVTENVVASAVGSDARSMDEDRQHEIIPTIMNPTEPVIEIDQRQYYQKQLKEPVAGHANSSVLDQPKQGESKFHDPVPGVDF